MTAKSKRASGGKAAKDGKPRAGTRAGTKAADEKRQAQTAKAKPPTGPRRSAFEQVLQATHIGLRRSQDVPWKQISTEVGLGVRRCQEILREMEKFEASHAQRVMSRDPVELVDWLLTEYQRDLVAYTLAALEAESDNARVGALNGREQCLQRIMQLLQATGRMPKNLGTVNVIHDLRILTRETMVLVFGLTEGMIDAETFKTKWAEAVGIEELPPIGPDDVRELVAGAAA